MKDKILEYLKFAKKKLRAREIQQGIGSNIDIKTVLEELQTEGKIVKSNNGRYQTIENSEYVCGRIQGSEKGYAFLRLCDGEDMFISEYALNGAIDGDTVLVKEDMVGSCGNKKEGIVCKILKKANEEIVGTVKVCKNKCFVIPDNKRIPEEVLIVGNRKKGVKKDQKVIIRITKRKINPVVDVLEGKIIEVLGNKKDKGVDILSVAKSYGLEESFDKTVLLECEEISDVVDDSVIKDRVDLRGLKMVTIDGEDAKDLDDAVSIEILENGNYKLGVHIADVSEYVKEGSFLDKEALKRGTSVYLIDRVIPMLPKKLSNGICSLNAKVDRLGFSVMMEIDKNGDVVDHDIFESVININERMTYTDVYKILEENNKKLKERYKDFVDDFFTMKELAKILEAKMKKRGAIDFSLGESKIELDENGKAVGVSEYKTTIANKIIEEFMVICNETVSEHFYWLGMPFVYRVHEEPKEDKIRNLSVFLKNLGYKLKVSSKVYPKALQKVLRDAQGKREEKIVSTVMLRSMQKAKYTTKSQGHFGLAAKFYSHFTSPIRRYPDLIIHRIMKEFLRGSFNATRRKYYEDRLEDIAKLCSDNERIAQDAEREVDDMKKCEYMKRYEGYVFDGIVSSITSFGIFVELPNTIEGLVRLRDLADDYYIFNEGNYSLIGERTGKTYNIGDEVRVKVARADKDSRQIDFLLVGKSDKRKKVHRRRKRKSVIRDGNFKARKRKRKKDKR
ncbi:MAG: ribonuclease R [Clostridiales bacterium]|nr:ribonuclease R [Clostridiales bacterium]